MGLGWHRLRACLLGQMVRGTTCGFRAWLHQLGEALIPRGTKSSNPGSSTGESQTKSACELCGWRTAAELYRADSAVRGAASQRKAKSGPANDRIAGGFDDPPAMLRDERIGGCAMLTLCLRRALVVRPLSRE